jgi:predicted RNA-binding protein with RPS1 domain
MAEIKSRVGNSFLKIDKWPDGKVSLSIKPHEGPTDCEHTRNSVGLFKEDIDSLIQELKN